MARDLTTSPIERQNVLNNTVAIPRIQDAIGIRSLEFNGKYYLTKQMVAEFFEVDVRTIDNYLSTYEDELKHNGYFLCKGKMLKEFKLHFAHEIDFASKTTQLGLFDFRSFLDIGMLLSDSEKARKLRSAILDIVIATINEKAGGGTKYINWRDREYLPAAIQEENYRKNFTSAINECVDGHKTFKYPQITDMIYKAVFFEKAKEYKELLNLKEADNARATMYSEVLRVISSFENGVAFAIRRESTETGSAISVQRVQELIDEQAINPAMTPFLYDARQKMASRDLGFRDVYHENISEYLKALSPEEFERFIGSGSLDLEKLLDNDENRAVLNRLKQ
jgi:hypothetical protein